MREKNDADLPPGDLRKTFQPAGYRKQNYILFWPHHSVDWGINHPSFKITNPSPLILPKLPIKCAVPAPTFYTMSAMHWFFVKTRPKSQIFW